jgi:hypothetical protein
MYNALFSKFAKPFSLRSNRFANPTAENGCAILGLPTTTLKKQ